MTMSSTSPADNTDGEAAPPPLPGASLRLPDVSGVISRPLMIIAAVVLTATFFLPPHGLGISGCFFKDLTKAPCMGCGMTRAVTCVSHGRLDEAWSYHPFVFLLWPAVVLLAAGGLISPFGRWLTRVFIPRHRALVSLVFWGVGAAYLIFGVVRIFVPALHGNA